MSDDNDWLKQFKETQDKNTRTIKEIKETLQGDIAAKETDEKVQLKIYKELIFNLKSIKWTLITLVCLMCLLIIIVLVSQ